MGIHPILFWLLLWIAPDAPGSGGPVYAYPAEAFAELVGVLRNQARLVRQRS
jgi:hypothetical protein